MSTKSKFQPEMFANAVMGIVLSQIGNLEPRDVIRETVRRDFVRVVTKPLPTFEDFLKAEGMENPYSNMTPENQKKFRERFKSGRETLTNRYSHVAKQIREWLDGYEIIFSGSEVRFGVHEKIEGEALVVQVQFPLDETPYERG